MKEIEKYKGIYNTPKRGKRYGSKNHGQLALPLIELLSPQAIVDIGCGWNNFISSCKTISPHIKAIGVDFACPGADVLADAKLLPFKNKVFDVLTCFDVLEHIIESDIDHVLKEFNRISSYFIFSISYVPSKWKYNGLDLHLTVKQKDWWLDHISHAGACNISSYYKGHYLIGGWRTSRININQHSEARPAP